MGRSRLGFVALAVALISLGGLSGCDAGRPPAAKVGQAEVSPDTLIADLEAEAARAKATESAGTPARDVPETYSAAAAAELLGRRIRYQLLGEVLRARDVSVTDEERDLAEQTLCNAGGAQVPEGECPGLEGYPTYYRRFQVELAARGNAYSAAIGREAGDETGARELYERLQDEAPDQLVVRCYVGASITTDESVQAIQVRVASGQSFADAVAAVEGAELTAGEECAPLSIFPEEVVAADDGVVLGPFQNQSGGSFVVQMGERRAGTFEEVSTVLQQQLAAENEQEAVEELLTKADVTVDPRYGRWNRETGTVDPPTGPTPATTDPALATS